MKDECPHCGGTKFRPWGGSSLSCEGCKRILRYSEVTQAPRPATARPRATRSISDRHEKKVAKQVGGRVTIASGSTPAEKGDVKAHDLRLECKSTEAIGYRLTLADLHKNEAAAHGEEIPVFAIEFRSPDRARPTQQYMVVSEAWFLTLLEAYRNTNT